MIDQLRITWAALRESGNPTGSDLAVRALAGATTPAGQVLLGIDGHGRSHVLIPVDVMGPEEDRVQAVRVTTRTLVVEGGVRRFVDVGLELDALEEVFDHFAVAVLEAVRQNDREHPAALAIEVLDEWRRFLVQSGRPLGPDRLAPIFAEMSVLADIAACGPGAVEAWRGPGARHDFSRGVCAIEVKATRAHTAREITVHGVDQLEPVHEGRLFLEFLRLEEAVGDGLSVPDLVDRVLGLGASASRLYAAVERAGLAPPDYEDARAVRFRVRERALLPVVDPFPRIVGETFVQGEMPQGVRDVVYRADLDAVMSSRLTPEDARVVYRELAGSRTG